MGGKYRGLKTDIHDYQNAGQTDWLQKSQEGDMGKKTNGGPSKAHCTSEERAIKFYLHESTGKRGKFRILQGKSTGCGVRRNTSRRNVKEIKMNFISGDNLKNTLKDISKIARFWARATPGRNENLAIGVDVYPTVTKRRRKGIYGICKGYGLLDIDMEMVLIYRQEITNNSPNSTRNEKTSPCKGRRVCAWLDLTKGLLARRKTTGPRLEE